MRKPDRISLHCNMYRRIIQGMPAKRGVICSEADLHSLSKLSFTRHSCDHVILSIKLIEHLAYSKAFASIYAVKL